MSIPVKETSPNVFERITGSRMHVFISLDGTEKAPLRTILADSWTAEDRARFGVFLAEPFVFPDGKRAVGEPRYERHGGIVHEVMDTEDSQTTPAYAGVAVTPREKFASFLKEFGMTPLELARMLDEAKASQ